MQAMKLNGLKKANATEDELIEALQGKVGYILGGIEKVTGKVIEGDDGFMSDYHNKRAAEIVKKITYATIATASKDGQPWNSPVYCNHDEDMNVYWVSDKEGQHSKNVKENNRVFIVIYDSTVPEGEGEGVYIQANASQVTDPDEILAVRRIKKGSHFEQSPDTFLGKSVRYMYKAVPERVWMNDAAIEDGVFIRDFRVEVPLDILKSNL